MGMSSTISSLAADSNATDDLRGCSSFSWFISPEISMDCGAPSRLCDNGAVFSSSAMLGNRLELVTGFELGDVMLAPLNGESTGDFAGLHNVLAVDKEILSSSRHLPVPVSSPQQLLQIRDAVMQALPLETPRLSLCGKSIVQQVNGARLLVDHNLQVQPFTLLQRTEATHCRREGDIVQLSQARTGGRSEWCERVVGRLLEGERWTPGSCLLCKFGGELAD